MGSPRTSLRGACQLSFTNNRERIHDPEYCKAGLPVTSAPMESLIKQINSKPNCYIS